METLEKAKMDYIARCKTMKQRILFGKIKAESSLTAILKEDEREEFWNLLSVNPNTILIIEEKKNTLNTSEISEEDEKEYSNEINIVNDNIGKIHSLKLAFSFLGVSIVLFHKASWRKEYKIIKELILYSDVSEVSEYKSEIDPVTNQEIRNDITKKLVDEIVADDRFQRYLTPIEVGQLAEIISEEKKLEENYEFIVVWNAKNRIIARYAHQIKPIFEKELRSKIQELKKKGTSKVAIGSELGIGISLVNKYYKG